MAQIEKRMTKKTLETRVDEQGNHVISGYAIVFNQPSEDMGFIEYVDPHALDDVDLSCVYCLYNHDFANILARSDTNTLILKVDDQGLAFNCQLPNTTVGRDVFENIRNGNIQGMSFGFTVAEDQWSQNDKGQDVRLIKKFSTLAEISLTAIPAYEETSVKAVRSRHEQTEEKRKLLLRINLIERIEQN